MIIITTTFLKIFQYAAFELIHFFEHYKDLEADKWVKVEGWVGVKEAKQEIKDSIERYKK